MSRPYELEEWCGLIIMSYCPYAYNILMKSLFHRGVRGNLCLYSSLSCHPDSSIFRDGHVLRMAKFNILSLAVV